jgi:methionine-rich copper-binding protein CopC
LHCQHVTVLIRSATMIGLAVLSMYFTESHDAFARSNTPFQASRATAVPVVDAVPADNAVLERPPERVLLRFSSGIDSRRTRIALVGPKDSSSLDIEGHGGPPVRELSIPVTDQGSGQYVVRWEIEATGGERIGGRVRFSVRR